MSDYKVIMALAVLLMASSTAFAQTGKARRRGLFSRKARVDSLRQQFHRAAAEGRAVQFGDSLFAVRLQQGKISEARYNRLRQRIRRYDRKLRRGDSLLATQYGKIKYDTLFISRPATRWTVKLRGNLSGAKIETRGHRDGTPYHGEVRSDYRGTMSVALSYRGIALGLALNPAKIAGKSKDNEFNLNSYGNKFGFDVVLLSSKTYKGYAASGGVRSDVSKGMVSQGAVNINAYYAFNGRRFSLPAAFTQSYTQKRSAGSVMLGLSFDGQKTDIDANPAIGYDAVKLRIVELGVGVGYGYNLVAGKHLLLHLSALPTFDVLVHSHISNGSERVNMGYSFPSAIFTGRGAAVYSWRNRFAGATMVYNFSAAGDDDNMLVKRDKWRVRLFYGFRF